MSNGVRASVVLLAALAFAACTAMQQQHSQPVRSDEGEFKNLKVLPQNITHDELITTMRGFARAMGRRCDACHVATPGGKEEFDFPSDAKDEKRNARTMILMTRNINNNFLPKIEHEPGETVDKAVCWTCHRGKMHPEEPPPAPQNRESH